MVVCSFIDTSQKMSNAQADGSMAKMTADAKESNQTSTGDSYTQAIINRDQKEQRKEDGNSGIFLIDKQNNTEPTAEKGKTNK